MVKTLHTTQTQTHRDTDPVMRVNNYQFIAGGQGTPYHTDTDTQTHRDTDPVIRVNNYQFIAGGQDTPYHTDTDTQRH